MRTDGNDLPGRGKRVGLVAVAVFVNLLGLSHPSQAAELTCAGGDVTCLIKAITAANENGEANTIRLGAGTYTLTMVDNVSDGPNGLPSITSPLSLIGAGAEATIIERAASAPRFRLVHVAATGRLALEGLTLQVGAAGFNIGDPATDLGGGGGLLNRGGTVTVTQSTIAHNSTSIGAAGGGLLNRGGTATVTQSTIAGNSASGGAGLVNVDGTATVTQSTIAGNGGTVGGLLNYRSAHGIGLVTLQSTILASNGASDCDGPVTSLGHNLLGTSIGCTVTLLASDVTGDPRLGDFTESDTPGRSYVPLLPDSPAIDAGNDEMCPDTDQLGQPRVKVNPARPAVCDIGAVEFQLGGPAVVPFAAFTVKVELKSDSFGVKGPFTLGAASDGIDPLMEDVGFQMGSFVIALPAGTFK